MKWLLFPFAYWSGQARMGFFRHHKAEATPPQPTMPTPGVAAPPPHAYWPPPLPYPMSQPPPTPPTGEPPRPAPVAGRRRWTSIVAGVVAAGTAVIAGTAGMMIYYTIVMPDPLTLRQKERAPVIRILAADGSVLAERGTAHDFMPLDLLPKHVTDAVVATEDRRFHDHWGIDPTGMARALFANMRAGRFAQGGSTLTQQLAKNLFLTPERTMTRKFEELLLAMWLELRLTKLEILELYLNRVYFGGGAYGIEAASQRYFEKSARELTIAEAAVIAGLLKAPSRYSPSASPGAARGRSRSVLSKMLAAGYIGTAEHNRALAERVRFASPKPSKESNGIEYAVDFVLERMPPLIGAGHAEVVVETTIDTALQKQAHAVVAHRLTEQGEALAVSQAALVVLDADGGIRALVGGRSYADSQYNRAVKARRQPGSAFKPFVYLAALESGLTPDTVTHDLPLTIEGWTPRNTNGRYQGAMPLRRALSESVNTVAARLQFDLGARRISDVAHRLGIKSDLREEPSLALGSSEVSLLELTGSYGVLANGGAAIEPHAIRRVRMSSGRVLYARRATRTEQVVAPAHVGAMNDMLNAALVAGTGRRAALARHPAAGKTGTTTDFRDALFVGFTAHYVAGVWVGNDNGKPMNKVMGGGLPAEIWRDVMVAAHAGKAPLSLPGTLHASHTLPSDDVRSPSTGAEPTPESLPWASAKPAPAKPAPPPPVARAKPQPAPVPETAATVAAGSSPPRGPRSPAEATPPVATTPPKSARAPAAGRSVTTHPTERIDGDFIARAVNGMPDGPQNEHVAGMTGGFDIETLKKRLETAPPAPHARLPGMMTLGTERP